MTFPPTMMESRVEKIWTRITTSRYPWHALRKLEIHVSSRVCADLDGESNEIQGWVTDVLKTTQSALEAAGKNGGQIFSDHYSLHRGGQSFCGVFLFFLWLVWSTDQLPVGQIKGQWHNPPKYTTGVTLHTPCSAGKTNVKTVMTFGHLGRASNCVSI